MGQSSRQRLRIWIIILIFLLAIPVQAVEKQQIVLQPFSLEANRLTLQWWIEGLRGQTVTSANLLVDGSIATTQSQLEPARGQAVCYMLMVDTSKSMVTEGTKGKSVTSGEIIDLLKAVLEEKPDQHSIGLMTFSQQANILVQPTQDKTTLLQALVTIKFSQSRTELFRFIENGVDALRQCPQAYRKVLLLVSDGIAEDQSFDKNDAVQFARKYSTSIYSFVIKDSLSLQNLIYLAEKTGGWGSEPADHSPQNRTKAVTRLYADSNNGGTLQAILPQGRPIQNMQLHVMLSDGESLTANLPPISIPVQSISGWKKKLSEWFPWLTLNQLNYFLWGLGLSLLLLLSWLAYRTSRPHYSLTEISRNPVGFIVHHGQSYSVLPGINSIGFLPTNDIIIDDDTVGRTHATLHYRGEGDVVLTDLNSLNGCWVNGNRIQHPTCIQDGDRIAFGEWQAFFQKSR